MNPRFVIIDEPVHIYNEQACKLWQQALWAKELGYRKEYSSGVIPMGADDFIATHLIIADEKPNGDLVPVVMYKSLKRSACEKFGMEFKATELVKGTEHEDSFALKQVLNDKSEISYDSSWSINPAYKKDKEFSKYLRDLTTVWPCNYHQAFGISRWITAGVTQFKIDKYFEYLGGKELLPEFELSIIDGQKVRMIYVGDTARIPSAPAAVNAEFGHLFNNVIIFSPDEKALEAKLIA